MKASPTMLLKTHVEKMSPSAYPTMFMKTMDLFVRSHDVHEKKGGYRLLEQRPRPIRQYTVDFDNVRGELNPWQLRRLTLALANPAKVL